MKDCLCLIPARGGSKRLPRKNIMPLGGKPLLAHTIDAALEACIFDDVIVSSDDDEILKLAAERGADTDRRPDALANDTAKVVEVVEEFLVRTGAVDTHKHIVVMLSTCPLRSVSDVQQGIAMYKAGPEGSTLVSVTGYDFPPELSMQHDESSHQLKMDRPETYRQTTRSQSFKPSYHPNGGFYAARVADFLTARTFFTNRMIGYVMPPERSVDIDYLYQFRMAEILLEHQSQNYEVVNG